MGKGSRGEGEMWSNWFSFSVVEPAPPLFDIQLLENAPSFKRVGMHGWKSIAVVVSSIQMALNPLHNTFTRLKMVWAMHPVLCIITK